MSHQIHFLKKLLKLTNKQRITNVHFFPIPSSTSTIFTIELHIRSDNCLQKKRLFVKQSKVVTQNTYHELCVNEINFYKLKHHGIHEILPKCYYTDIDTYGNTTLILEDLSKNFFTVKEGKIDNDALKRSCSALSRLHAFFWNYQNFNDKLLPYTVPNELVDNFLIYVKNFLHENSRMFSQDTLEIIDAALNIYISILNEEEYRRKIKENITLINGDAHIYNFMFSKRNDLNTKITDFQFWKIGLGCIDLAHLTRKIDKELLTKEFHQNIVKNYYYDLISYGVNNYSYDQCYQDYKLCVASLVLNPIWQYSIYKIPFDICIKPLDTLIRNFKTLVS